MDNNPSEKLYDMIKIKVRLGENHYFILSRFLISRMLTLCRVRKVDAINIAKAIKKHFIECNLMETTQTELQCIIFQIMVRFGYESSIPKYQMVNQFYAKRTPMVILVLGAPCIGKSLIANNLAERLNVSNVLQTSIVEIVMRLIDERYQRTLMDLDEIEDEETLLVRFKQYCRIIRQGVSVDIQKCLSEGKPVIIEGNGIIPELYIDALHGDLLEDHGDKLVSINQYIENEVKLRKQQRKDWNLFNVEDQVKRKWRIVYPCTIDDPMKTQQDNMLK